MEKVLVFLAALFAVAALQCTEPGCGGCTDTSCGTNADCFFIANQVTCVCRIGFVGDPYKECCNGSDCGCHGDPHCKTLDGTFYDYQGTCPYVYSTPCRQLNDDKHFVVKAMNKLFYPKSPVSYVSEIEVEMYDQILHVDETLNFQVNGIAAYLPFYYPSRDDPLIVAELIGGQVHIRNSVYVTVIFSKQVLKMKVPHLEEYLGEEGLCGHAGNLNQDCSDDLVSIDGRVEIEKTCRYAVDKTGLARVAEILDTWITDEFGGWDSSKGDCRTGKGLAPDLPTCDTSRSSKECLPIKQALEGRGPFAQCKRLGKETITMAYESCVFDGCFIKDSKCETFKNFAKTCQANLGRVDLSTWRTVTGCPMDCSTILPFSTYSSCMSGCQPTCANQKLLERCNQPCFEGCQCKPGFVLDTSANPPKCVQPMACACIDKLGNSHPPNYSWLSDNCTKKNVCIMGAIYTESFTCMQHAHCGVEGGYMACLCDCGFRKSPDKKRCIR
ncbi:hypothetical protein QR680_010374 [Steinernema hermaphroditum]|uniref:VWFD domain-containing protein n=1 Tax=Steinernema hermaphroditum TaxID=289476 RepID=A0AA39IPY7_9BILA|nr:hypothetical protein QR680_010374 [Steinernema hermaphroditum]